jgi:hypothetical protein
MHFTLSSFKFFIPQICHFTKEAVGVEGGTELSDICITHFFFLSHPLSTHPHSTPLNSPADSCGKHLTHFLNLYANQVGLTAEEICTLPGLKLSVLPLRENV